jgi:hypothetical protein
MPVEPTSDRLLRWDLSLNIVLRRGEAAWPAAQQPDGLHCGSVPGRESLAKTGVHIETDVKKLTPVLTQLLLLTFPRRADSSYPIDSGALALQSLAEESHCRSSHRITLRVISHRELSN